MTCRVCGTELEPVALICPGCGARVSQSRERLDWRQQVHETVERHKAKKRREQTRRDDGARQLTIFPESSEDDPEERAARARRAEIRARVEERLSKRSHSEPRRAVDAGEVAISSAGAGAAYAREFSSEPARDTLDAKTAELDPVPEPSDERELELDVDEPGGEGASVAWGLASPGERLLGGLLDLSFVSLIQLTLFYLTTHLVSQRVGALPISAIGAMVTVGVVLSLLYFLFFWGLSGQTLGGLVTGGRVVNRKGRALGFGGAVVRLAGCLISILPLGAGFVGLWTDPERRTWHDRLADSKVVSA